MSAYLVDSIINTLTDVTDLQRVLNEHDMSAARMLQLMRSARGKQQIKARRQLAKIHSELVAHRFSPYAVHKLCQLLSDDKSELRLKGALSILSVAGLGQKRERASKKKSGADAKDSPPAQTPEDLELLAIVAEAMAKRRAAEAD